MSAAPAGAILYTRRACPLCYEAERLARRSSRRHGVRLSTADVDDDPALAALYGQRVPVLTLPGGAILEARATAAEIDAGFRGAADFLARIEGRTGRDVGASGSALARIRRFLAGARRRDEGAA